jgi:hypothetical protein
MIMNPVQLPLLDIHTVCFFIFEFVNGGCFALLVGLTNT